MGISLGLDAASDSTTTTASSSSRRMLLLQQQQVAAAAAAGCGAAARPVMRVQVDPGWQVASVVWKDNLNRTFAAGPEVLTAGLPLPAALDESSGPPPTPTCSAGSCMAIQQRYSVHVLAEDGSHSGAFFSFSNGSLQVTYKNYDADTITLREEVQPVGFDWPPGCATAAAAASGGAGGRAGGQRVLLVVAIVLGVLLKLALAATVMWCWRDRRAQRQQYAQQLASVDADYRSSVQSDSTHGGLIKSAGSYQHVV